MRRRYNNTFIYYPLYICVLRVDLAEKLNRSCTYLDKYQSYQDIQDMNDRLRWLRFEKNLTQAEVANAIGVERRTYANLEIGKAKTISDECLRRLSDLFGVEPELILDDYNLFIRSNPGERIKEYRHQLGMFKNEFARYLGVNEDTLSDWENGRVVISRRSWEQYFKDRIVIRTKGD